MKNYHLHLRGFVGGYDFDSNHVQNVLTANKDNPVDVLIDSLGGSVATALSIASAFRAHGDVHVHFVGMNASAATIVSMGAKNISMDASAMYLVHKCSSEFFQWASLNADQLEQQIQELTQTKYDLDKIDVNVATLYAKRCGKSKEELLSLMKTGGWLNAIEAKDWGFVDEITDEEEDSAPVLTDSVASAMAAVGMPVPNLPIQSSSKFQDFLAALTEIFRGSKNESKTSQHNQTIINMKKFPLLAAALQMADAQLPIEGGTLPLEEPQLTKIEDALKKSSEEQQVLNDEIAKLQTSIDSKNLEIQQLKNQIETLNKQPGETTKQVHNNAGLDKETGMTVSEDFFQTLNSARALFNAVP